MPIFFGYIKKLIVMLVYGCISGFQPDEVTPITFTPGAARGCDGLGFQPFPLQNCNNISLFYMYS